jgi:hypothetical protein
VLQGVCLVWVSLTHHSVPVTMAAPSKREAFIDSLKDELSENLLVFAGNVNDTVGKEFKRDTDKSARALLELVERHKKKGDLPGAIEAKHGADHHLVASCRAWVGEGAG